MKMLFAISALMMPAAALAANNVSLDSKIFVEQQTRDEAGNVKSVLTPVAEAKVTPGDNLIFVLSYKNSGNAAASDFIVTNPLPSAVAYTGHEGEAPQVSIDGGKSWGPLASLKVTEADGTIRDAQASDVTHVRWAFGTAIPAGQTGKLSFRGVVK
jgi:uncharacterized repeat protein (TIGR01451 family)